MPRPRIPAEPWACRILAPHKPMAPYNPKGPPRPAQGLPRSWIGQKLGLPKPMVSPESILPPDQFRTSHGSAGCQDPGEGRPARRLRQSSPLVELGRPTVNCSFTVALWTSGGCPSRRRRRRCRLIDGFGVCQVGRSHCSTARTTLTVNCTSVDEEHSSRPGSGLILPVGRLVV